MDPNSGREKHVTEGGKGVRKRGDGLGTGPVGRKDGYSGRSSGSTGSGPSQGRPSGQSRPYGSGRPNVRPEQSGTQRSGGSGGRGSLGIIVIVVIILLVVVFGRGCFTGSNQTSTGYSQNNTQTNTNTAQTQNNNSSGSSVGDLFGMLTGYTGSNGVTTGWSGSSGSNTAVLNREVDPSSREKRTQIIGDGSDTVTIMVYMCGTDLESKSGMATKDLMEMCSASLSDRVNILIYTGGCKSWRVNGISSTVNQIYRVTSSGLERLVEDDGSKVMTDPATLTSFIRWCAENYPANRNDLIFWDHGSGSISGYGYDEKYPNKGSMSLSGINRALADSGMTFDFIGFDACLMATLETALMASNYADYLIASEETEPGIGWYYTDWLSSLSADTSQATIDTGKNIVDSFVDECARSCSGQKATLSLTDLAELETTVPDKFVAFSGNTTELINSDGYKQVSDARADTREFAVSSKIDQIDLVDFTNRIGTDAAADLADVLLEAVKYNRTSSNMTNAYGLSIYFPYKKASKVDSMTSIYEDIGINSEYSDCIRSFAGLETCAQISAGGTSSPFASLTGSSDAYSDAAYGSDAISALLSSFLSGGRSVKGVDLGDFSWLGNGFNLDLFTQYIAENHFDPSGMVWYEDNEGRHLMALADDQWDLIQSLQINMFYDDGEGYIDLGLDNTWEFTSDGRLIGDTDNTWISIDGQPVAYYYETTIIEGNNKTVTGRVPAFLNGERVNLILVFDNENPHGYIAGASYVYAEDETETVAKSITEIEEGAQIDFICDYYAYDETYLDSYLLGEPIRYKDGLEISNTYVGSDVRVTYLLTDMYDNEYWTPVVP